MERKSRKRQQISVDLKIKIIEQSKTMSYTEMMKLFNLSNSTISTIVKGKDKTLEAAGDGYDKKRIKIRPSDHLNLEKSVITWLAQARNQNIPVSGPLLQEKAKEMAEKLSIDHFSASDEWLFGFKERHSIRFRTEQDEATSVDPQVVKQWKTDDLARLTEGFNLDDVYNGDETGLFWRLLPIKTLCFKGTEEIVEKKNRRKSKSKKTESTEEVIRTFAGQDLDDNDEEEMIERLPVSIQQARQSFNIFRHYCQENSIGVELFPILGQFDDKLHCDRIAKMLQSKISDFYNFL